MTVGDVGRGARPTPCLLLGDVAEVLVGWGRCALPTLGGVSEPWLGVRNHGLLDVIFVLLFTKVGVAVMVSFKPLAMLRLFRYCLVVAFRPVGRQTFFWVAKRKYAKKTPPQAAAHCAFGPRGALART